MVIAFEVLADVLNVALDTALVHAVVLCFFGFIDKVSIHQLGVDAQYAGDFIKKWTLQLHITEYHARGLSSITAQRPDCTKRSAIICTNCSTEESGQRPFRPLPFPCG